MSVFKSGRKPAGLTRSEALACIPVKNPEIVERRSPGGDLLLLYPVRARPLFGRLLRRLSGSASAGSVYRKKLQLDALGTAVWERINSRRSVRSIIAWFATEYRMHPREAEVAVTHFLRDLGKRGLVGLK